jgi:hypothetical protein
MKELENVLVSGVAKYNRTNLVYLKYVEDKLQYCIYMSGNGTAQYKHPVCVVCLAGDCISAYGR